MDNKTTTLKAKILNFGCQMNIHDSERMASILENNGFVVDFKPVKEKKDLENIDYLIVNTCTIREKPETKWLSILNSFINKKNRPVVAVTGCVAQQKQEILLQEKVVDIVLGVDKEDTILNSYNKIQKARHNKDKSIKILEKEFLDQLPTNTLIRKSPNKFAYVMISTGCNNYCSYCIVPFVRGREISRSIENIISDVKNLVQNDGKEFITILAQNIAKYGHGTNDNLYTLLDKLSQITGLKRLSFLTSHPRDFDTNIINLMEERSNISTLLHLPAQHGSSRLLKLMNRGYTREDYLKLVDKIYSSKIADQINFTTDIILGFPTENDNDFNELMSLLKIARFDNSFSFIYSPRPGTVAYKQYSDKYSTPKLHKVYTDRLAKYQELQKIIAQEKNNKYIGKTDNIFIENIKDNIINGRTNNGKLIHIPNNNIKIKNNSFVKAEITKAHATFLEGKLLNL